MIGQNFESILKGKYPGKAHARRVTQLLRAKVPGANGILYLEGRASKMLEDSDEPEPFRQRRHFYYLTGCDLSNCYLIYDMDSSKSTLFIPPIDPEEVIWSGMPISPEEAKKAYDVDEVQPSPDLSGVLAQLAASKQTVYTIAGHISEHVKLEFAVVDSSVLKSAIESSRAIKDEYEVAMIRKANSISSSGHEMVLKQLSTQTNEMQAEATFQGYCAAQGAKKMAYTPVVAAGRASATLHYEANNRSFHHKINLLFDAGCEWNNYASDITRTFPISGTFSKESREIYAIVHNMQSQALVTIKDGVQWEDVHLLCHEIAVDGLLSLGILSGRRSDILQARTSLAFFPHGLGHHLGLETHDVGVGSIIKEEDEYFQHLRFRGPLQAGNVITVEPGIYFCEHIINLYLQDEKHKSFINKAVLERYWDVGGIRLEDNVLVTPDVIEDLTTVTKDVNAIGALFHGA